jgi:hypothetical protein
MPERDFLVKIPVMKGDGTISIRPSMNEIKIFFSYLLKIEVNNFIRRGKRQ